MREVVQSQPQSPARRRGRPATGRDQVFPVRIPATLVAEIDAWRAGYAGMSRGSAFRCLAALGLKVPKSSSIRDPKDPAGRWVPGKVYRGEGA
jgi:hypothetical protein